MDKQLLTTLISAGVLLLVNIATLISTWRLNRKFVKNQIEIEDHKVKNELRKKLETDKQAFINEMVVRANRLRKSVEELTKISPVKLSEITDEFRLAINNHLDLIEVNFTSLEEHYRGNIYLTNFLLVKHERLIHDMHKDYSLFKSNRRFLNSKNFPKSDETWFNDGIKNYFGRVYELEDSLKELSYQEFQRLYSEY